jgi:hypothetical protein
MAWELLADCFMLSQQHWLNGKEYLL